jgi:hypothetical protein
VTEKSTRRFWQIHLSTALAGTLVAGTLLGLNLRPPQVIARSIIGYHKSASHPERLHFKYATSGWPWAAEFYMQAPHADMSNSDRAEWQGVAQRAADKEIEQFEAGRFFSWNIVFWNFGAALALTFGSCALFEYMMHRRGRADSAKRQQDAETEDGPEMPKRKFWRIHLSTAVALVVVFGAFLRANMQDRGPIFTSDEPSGAYYGPFRGWPLPVERTGGPKADTVLWMDDGTPYGYYVRVRDFERIEIDPKFIKAYPKHYLVVADCDAFAVNLALAAATLVIVLFGFEYLNRRWQREVDNV